jgi:hypothetical protein
MSAILWSLVLVVGLGVATVLGAVWMHVTAWNLWRAGYAAFERGGVRVTPFLPTDWHYPFWRAGNNAAIDKADRKMLERHASDLKERLDAVDAIHMGLAAVPLQVLLVELSRREKAKLVTLPVLTEAARAATERRDLGPWAPVTPPSTLEQAS